MELGRLYSYRELVDLLGEETIVSRYVPNFKKVNKSFRLRDYSEDKHPSCRVFSSEGRLLIKDFGDIEYDKARSIPQFIMDEYKKSYDEMLDMVYLDFKEDITRTLKVDSNRSKSKNKVYKDKQTKLPVKYRNWMPHDIKYWGQYGLTIKILEKAGIRPIEYYWIDSARVNNMMFKADKYAYSYDYYYQNDVFRRKIYQPFSKFMKWLSNCKLDVVQNFENLPKEGELLVIQSSLKDALVMNTFDYYSGSPISESTWFTEQFWNKLSQRFTDILYFANNDWNKKDNPGLVYGEKISNTYNIPYIYIPSKFKCSDISDFRSKYGYDTTKELLDELI